MRKCDTWKTTDLCLLCHCRLIQTMLVLTAVCCWLLYPFKLFFKFMLCITGCFMKGACIEYYFTHKLLTLETTLSH